VMSGMVELLDISLLWVSGVSHLMTEV